MNKRIGKRIDFKKEAEIIDSTKRDILCKVKLLNLSTGGACCISERTFEIASTYILKLPMTLSKVFKLPIQIVAQHEKDGSLMYSIKFIDINMIEKGYIRNYINSLNDPYRREYHI